MSSTPPSRSNEPTTPLDLSPTSSTTRALLEAEVNETEIFNIDNESTSKPSAEEIMKKLIENEIDANELAETTPDIADILNICNELDKEMIASAKRIKESKTVKALEKSNIFKLAYATHIVHEAMEKVRNRPTKVSEVPYRGNILNSPDPDYITYNIARENKKLKKKVDDLQWKYKDFDNVKMGKKKKNGAIAQYFHRPIIKDCCGGFIPKPAEMTEEASKKVLDVLNGSNNVITTNKKKVIEVDSTCRCNGHGENCAIKCAKERIISYNMNVDLKVRNKKLPSIRIISTNTEADLISTWDGLKRNLPDWNLADDPVLITEFIHRSKRAKSFIVQTDPETRLALAGRNFTLIENKAKLYIRDSIHVIYCRFCEKYGHSLGRCRSKPTDSEVTYNEPPKCTKCTEPHSPFDLSCKQRYRFIASRVANIDYGERLYPTLSLWQ